MLGDKLVKTHLFDTDLLDEPLLPSPNQLKYKILIKNKKIQRNLGQCFNNAQTQSSSQPVQIGITNNGNATPKQQLSQNSKSSIWPGASRLQSCESRTKGSRVLSTDETYAHNNENNEEVIEIEQETPNAEIKISQQQASNSSSKLGAEMVKRIRTISTRLTAAEPKLKQNVVNLIHKSKSLTDSAFNRINANSKVKPNTHAKNSTDANAVNEPCGQQQQQCASSPTETSFFNTPVSPTTPSASASVATSVLGIANSTISNKTDLGSVDLSYLARIKKRFLTKTDKYF